MVVLLNQTQPWELTEALVEGGNGPLLDKVGLFSPLLSTSS